jgi:hypothetical protein
MMSEATGPLPVITETTVLTAVSAELAAEMRKTQEAVRRALVVTGPLTELVMLERRLAELEATLRKATMYELTRDALDAPPLAAVPGPRSRHRHRRRVTGGWPLRAIPSPPR